MLRHLQNAVIAVFGTLFFLVIAGALAGFGVFYFYGRDLPDYQKLADYEPPTVTRFYAGDGRLLAEYAKEKRVFVPIEAVPQRLIDAFLSAEDKNFYHHIGVNPLSIGRAAVDNLRRIRNDERLVGASTITQQVAKNFLLTNERSIERKIKEAILALRMERAFTKDRVLELYLNEIYLGIGSYGVVAAALNYFNKSLDELTIAESAYLAALPKAPSRYHPVRQHNEAKIRRDWVIGRLLADGRISEQEAAQARAQPLTMAQRAREDVARADYFSEEVRRRLVARYGDDVLYEGGLAVRTTVDPSLQNMADSALRAGLVDYDRARGGWRGPISKIDIAGDWQAKLRAVAVPFDLMRWRRAVALDVRQDRVEIGLADGTRGVIPLSEMTWARRAEGRRVVGAAISSARQVLDIGDVVAVERLTDGTSALPRYTLRQNPLVQGAVVALDPHTGRILAMSGGFSFKESSFNRATQALRQPGSAFKPFVYLSALEAGKTPGSIIIDGPIEIDQGPGLPIWKPENYSQRYYGPSTMRLGLEKSRNLMTVRLAQEVGMERVVNLAERFGIERELGTNLAGSLGANEVTPLDLAAAYAMLVNGGKKIEPILIDRLQDRYGRTVLRRDRRDCSSCQMTYWDGLPPPIIPDRRQQVVDPRLAYQMVNMLKGVVERGTGARALEIGKPLAGKTGTTNDSKDTWFIGFSPDLVVAVYVGFDQPAPLGDKVTGSSLALPIFVDVMNEALQDQPPTPFRTPPGVSLVRVDAQNGLLPGAGTETTIEEAFLPGTEPRQRSTYGLGSAMTSSAGGNTASSSPGSPVLSGGLY